ncbi:MAG: glutathione S-transferase family protein [Gammaproteobacteria bacterium]
MSPMLNFYTNPMSRGRIVRWMLEEIAAPYTVHLLDYGTTMKAAEYLAVNPMGKVPAIEHDGVVVTECAAICAYLADAFPASGLAPPPAERGAYYRWLFYFAGPVESAVVNEALGFEVPEGREAMSGYGGSLAAVVDVLDGHLSRSRYVAGESFTAADVYCGSQVGWGMQFGTLEERPAFVDYWQRLSSRPAYVRATELDDALVPRESD